MWFVGADIVSTFGGQAGMQSSQPLQCSTSIVTVPRLVIVRVVGSDSDTRGLPGRERVRGEEVPARA